MVSNGKWVEGGWMEEGVKEEGRKEVKAIVILLVFIPCALFALVSKQHNGRWA